MQAIRTTYCGPTDLRGARVRACCKGGSVYVPYQSELGIEENHQVACDALRRKLGWSKVWAGGCYKGGEWYWVPVFQGHCDYLNAGEA